MANTTSHQPDTLHSASPGPAHHAQILENPLQVSLFYSRTVWSGGGKFTHSETGMVK